MFEGKPARKRYDPHKATQKAVRAFGGPPIRKPSVMVRAPFDKAYTEDLEWAQDYINARLYEIDLQFEQPQYNRPQKNKGCTVYERELFDEENGLKGILLEVEHQLEKAPTANDTLGRKKLLDNLVEEQLASTRHSIERWEKQSEFREARLRRLLLPQLRIDLRAQYCRY